MVFTVYYIVRSQNGYKCAAMNAVQLIGRPTTRTEVSSFVNISSNAIKPVCGQQEILVKVKAASVTVEDLNYATGSLHYALVSPTPTPDNPVILGQEFSGVVEEVGGKVENIKVGEAVLGTKPVLRERCGCWAEYLTIPSTRVVTKPEHYTWAEAAALPLPTLVAATAVRLAGYSRLPRIEIERGDTRIETCEDNQAMIVKAGDDTTAAREATVCVVGASTSVGMMVVEMLATRRIKVVGTCSKKSAASVLARGAVAVLDRNRNGGLGERGDLTFTKIIDCVGGHQVEMMCREVLGRSGHLISLVRPGVGPFGDESRGVVTSLAAFSGTATRSVRSLFSQMKYSLVTLPMIPMMPMMGQKNLLEEVMREEIKPVIDCEVEMDDETKVRNAIDRVVQHKTSGRVVFVNNQEQ